MNIPWSSGSFTRSSSPGLGVPILHHLDVVELPDELWLLIVPFWSRSRVGSVAMLLFAIIELNVCFWRNHLGSSSVIIVVAIDFGDATDCADLIVIVAELDAITNFEWCFAPVPVDVVTHDFRSTFSTRMSRASSVKAALWISATCLSDAVARRMMTGFASSSMMVGPSRNVMVMLNIVPS